MEARIGHVTDTQPVRPTFGILYRRYQDVRASYLQVQAGSDAEAMRALTQHVGNLHYVVTSLRHL